MLSNGRCIGSAGRLSALPATVTAFADIALTVGAFLGHGINSFAFC